jgi:predicted PurR-regulated permease PerM
VTEPTPAPQAPAGHGLIRDVAAFGLAAALFMLLLLGVLDALNPPIVYVLFVWAIWPLRARHEVRSALVIGTALLLLWFFRTYGALLTPFLVSIGAAYIIAPLVALLTKRGVNRALAIVGVVVPILAVVATIVTISGPQLFEQSQTLITKLPSFAERAVEWIAGIGDRLARLPFLSREQQNFLSRLDAQQLGQILQSNAQQILGRLGGFGVGLLSHLGSVLGLLAYVVVVPVVTFYLLLDWAKFTTSVANLIPPSRRDTLMGFVDEYDRALGQYIRGQLLEATIVGVLTTVGLAILGVPSALLIGVITGVFNLIPYVGFAVSIIPALVVALTMDDPMSGLIRVIIVFASVQFIDGSVTGPRIVGNSVGLHPIWIMIALTLSGAFFGFTGLLLAIPLAVLVKLLLVKGLAKYKASSVYNS